MHLKRFLFVILFSVSLLCSCAAPYETPVPSPVETPAVNTSPLLGEYVRYCTEYEMSATLGFTKQFTFVSPVASYYLMQGSCISADGKYYFAAFNNGKDGNEGQSILAKYDINAQTTVATNKTAGCNHANDICYIPENDIIAVVHNEPNYKSISLFRASDLVFIDTVTCDVKIHSLSYCGERGQFVAGISGAKDNFAILDKDFKTVKKFDNPSAGGTHQGGDCDEEYIYFVQSDKEGASPVNLLITYDWDGNKIDVTPLPEVTYEIEGITHAGGDYYFTYYRGWQLKGGEIYKIDFQI